MKEAWNNLWIEADTWWKKLLYGLLYAILLGVAFIVCLLSGMVH